jgi:hypothetical protein
VAFLVLMMATSAARAFKPDAPPGVDLTGYWRLNTARSDDAEALLQEKLEDERRERERWMRRQGFNDPLGIPPLAESQSDAAPPTERRAQRPRNRRLQQLRDMLGITDTLYVTQTGNRIQMQSQFDVRSFEAGSKSQVSMPEGELADSRVGWEGPWFVIERRAAKGPRVLEKYRWLKKTDQLESVLAWSGDSPLDGIKVHRIFDRIAGAPPPPDPNRGPVK